MILCNQCGAPLYESGICAICGARETDPLEGNSMSSNQNIVISKGIGDKHSRESEIENRVVDEPAARINQRRNAVLIPLVLTAVTLILTVPLVRSFLNYYGGAWAYNFEMRHTYPKWKWLLEKFGSTPERVFGVYTPENAIPWYGIVLINICIFSLVLAWVRRDKSNVRSV